MRWLLCGRGRPVDGASLRADYVVVLTPSGGFVLHPDIEASRVESEERFEELGYEPVAYPWHAGPETAVAEILAGAQPVTDGEAEDRLTPHRRLLHEPERERFRAAGADCAEAVEAALDGIGPQVPELEAAAELAHRTRERGFFPGVVLVACDRRQRSTAIRSRRRPGSAPTRSSR